MKKRRYIDDFVLNEAARIIDTLDTYKEIADHMGIPLSTVGWHMKVRLKNLILNCIEK